ncbi:MAG: hypothetical protein ACTHNS_04755 [Marmoricola sp.]
MSVLEGTMGVSGEMIWFVITAIAIVIVVGGGMMIALRAYTPRRRR